MNYPVFRFLHGMTWFETNVLGPIGSPETCVSNHPMPRNNPTEKYSSTITILNNVINLAPCDPKLSHQLFRLTLIWDLIQETGRVPWTQTTRQDKKHKPKAPSISQKNIFKRTNALLWKGREMGAVRVPLKTMQRMQQRVVCHPMFQGVSHQTAFLRTS